MGISEEVPHQEEKRKQVDAMGEKQFGEFGSYVELNRAAGGLLEEGDLKGLKKLASENGIPAGMVKSYMEGKGEFCDAQAAAIGKLETEAKALKDPLADAVMFYLVGKCEKEKFAMGVMAKGRTLKGFVEKMKKEAEGRVKERTGMQAVVLNPDEVFREARNYFGKGKEPWKKQR